MFGRLHPTTFDRSPRSAVDPRHAWMLFDLSSKYSISMEIHPRMAWIYRPAGNWAQACRTTLYLTCTSITPSPTRACSASPGCT
ncbi:hypothetical protein E5C33_14905 [Stenotrophomonas maltophilia]|nr:hypothetical protein E5C33_14905 [Stenotrophomonas maltophilia]